MKRNKKPVRKCNGCELNMSDHCAIYPYPYKNWIMEDCCGYNNDTLIMDYERMLLRPINKRKENRTRNAKHKQTIERCRRVRLKTKIH